MIIEMKKLLTLFTSFVLTLIVLVIPTNTFAQDNISNTFTLEKQKVVDQNPYFAYGESVVLSGTVNGDTYVAGGKVSIDGDINGDLLIAGGEVEILGDVKEDIRVIGGQVTIKGNVGKNVSVVGGDIRIDENSVISKSLTVAGGNIEVMGQIKENLNIAGGMVSLNNKIGGNFNAAAGQIVLGDETNIPGKFEYWSDEKPSVSQDAVIKGQTVSHAMPVKVDAEKEKVEAVKNAVVKATIVAKVFKVLSLLVIGFLLIKLSTKFMVKASEIIETDFWKSMGFGFLIVFLTPMVFVILLLTVIGGPIALITLTLYFVMLYMAKVFAIFALGIKIFPKKSIYLSYFIAVLIYSLIRLIPVIGGIAGLVTLLVGMGAFAISKKNSLQEYNK